MSKRPFQENNRNAADNRNSKKLKSDSDGFKAPGAVVGSSSHQSNQAPKQPPVSRKIPLPSHPVISEDQSEDDYEIDDVLCMFSQQAEEEELRRNQQRQQASKEMSMNLSYGRFASNAAGSSTQQPMPPPTGNTEQIRNELFVIDLTAQEELESPKNPSSDLSSQKENMNSAQLMLTRQQNRIKELEQLLKKQNDEAVELQNKLTEKSGEASTMRLAKKSLEEKIKTLQLQKIQDASMKVDPEKEKLRREVDRLKTERNLQKINDFPRSNRTIIEEKVSPAARPKNFVHLPVDSGLKLSSLDDETFEIEKSEIELANFSSNQVMEVQLELAKANAKILNGGFLDEKSVNSLFKDAAQLVLQISKYVSYLEAGRNSFEIKFDNEPTQTFCAFLSTPVSRGTLSGFSPFYGKQSILQLQDLFPGELCTKPRRILAIYSTIARQSKEFSEKLLAENVTGDPQEHRTFVSVLIDTLNFKIAESDNVFEYAGFVLSVAALLASLSTHYKKFTHKSIVDDGLYRLFRAVLDCQCDNPQTMKFLSEFLVNASQGSFVKLLCVSFPKSKIDISRLYKFCHYQEGACTFQLFLMYLLTAFNFTSDPNDFEIELLLETTLNLNRIVTNFQIFDEKSLKFLIPNDPSSCSCFSTLTHAILMLNQMSLDYRNVDLYRIVPKKTEPEPQKVHALIRELIISGSSVIADLFRRIDPFSDYPVENLVFSNRLEYFSETILRGKKSDLDFTEGANCLKAYELTDECVEILKSINLAPTVVAGDIEEEAVDEANELLKVEICRNIICDGMQDNSL